MRMLGRKPAVGKGTIWARAFFRHRRFTWSALGLLALLAAPLSAQQSEPAVEVFALTGSYFHGNQATASRWRPQFGTGVIVPLGRRWATIFDVTTSAAETFWKQGSPPGLAGPNDNVADERLVVLTPSLVWMWRRGRFSLYGGGGGGFEHIRRQMRFRPTIGHDENGLPILADEFQNTSSNRTHSTLLLRGGTIVSLTRRAVFRVEYSLLRKYIDERASSGVSVGIGYRF